MQVLAVQAKLAISASINQLFRFSGPREAQVEKPGQILCFSTTGPAHSGQERYLNPWVRREVGS